jgi:hypothetical protein
MPTLPSRPCVLAMMLNEKNTELAMEKKEKSLHQEHKMYASKA